MTPPKGAQALIAICAPPNDRESVLGDLHEEYVRRLQCEDRARADSWYWGQALGSIPSLLSYTRTNGTSSAAFITGGIVISSILAMMMANELFDDVISTIDRAPHGIGLLPFFLAGWITAGCFGGLIAAVRPAHGVRLVLISAATLLAIVGIPIGLHTSSQLSLQHWLLVAGAAISMIAGGGTYHFIRFRLAFRHT